jgi:uncharacterized protein (TIGR03084 family)
MAVDSMNAAVQLRDRLVEQLGTESDDLLGRVRGLSDDELRTPTPAPGWSIVDTLAHLAGTDQDARQALTDPDAFRARLPEVLAEGDLYTEHAVQASRHLPPRETVTSWADGYRRLGQLLASRAPGERIPWFGPAMGLASFISARTMETWAHGQDVADALGQERAPTERLFTVADIGVRARPFAFMVNGLAPPEGDVRVELTGPDGETWAWGAPDAAARVSGPALDFCLLVTRRRHRDDVALEARGDVAVQWLGIAQAYAGSPGAGRRPSGAAVQR